jgi:hypothetical protein
LLTKAILSWLTTSFWTSFQCILKSEKYQDPPRRGQLVCLNELSKKSIFSERNQSFLSKPYNLNRARCLGKKFSRSLKKTIKKASNYIP